MCVGRAHLVVVVIVVRRLVAVEVRVPGALLGAEADRRRRNRHALREVGEEKVGE